MRFVLPRSSREPPRMRNVLQTLLGHNEKHTHKGVCFSLAQRRGFEPPVRFRRTHDFQSCSLNHSDISAFFRRFLKSAYLYYFIFLKKASVFALLSKKTLKFSKIFSFNSVCNSRTQCRWAKIPCPNTSRTCISATGRFHLCLTIAKYPFFPVITPLSFP